MENAAHKKDPEKRNRLYVHTFGCQMNEYDSRSVFRAFASRGYSVASSPSEADIIFVNTCSVRQKAEQKVFSLLGRLRKLKARDPGLRIIVAGCVAQQMGKTLLERFDWVDLVIGTRGVASTLHLLDEVSQTGRRIAHTPDEPVKEALFEQSHGACSSTPVVSSITIMQGCDNYCTYCIVPYVRGPEHSRPSLGIVHEIEMTVKAGTREILLLGQNVNSYGRGLNEKVDFPGLLRRIHTIPDLSRIRFTTSHPKDLTDELMRCFSDLPKLCRHLHLPFQAGSDRVLKIMNRGYTSGQYHEKIRKIRRLCPDIALSSDVMVGFPGETEEDFQATMQLLQEVQFDALFSFQYSDRPNTESSRYPDKVDEGTKARRLAELQSLQSTITLRKNLQEVGKSREILVEGASRASNGQLTGRTHQNRIVNFAGPGELAGRSVNVRIIAAFSHSLRGELVTDAPCSRVAPIEFSQEESCSGK